VVISALAMHRAAAFALLLGSRTATALCTGICPPTLHTSTFAATPPARAAVLLSASASLPDEMRSDADTVFALLDLDGDGELSAEEFRVYLMQYSYTDSAVEKIFDALDLDGSGTLCIDELRETFAEYDGGDMEPWCEAETAAEADAMFDCVDLNDDGKISAAELHAHLLTLGYTGQAAEAVFQSFDTNNDGELSRDELVDGFVKYARLRQTIIAVVKSLVKSRRWSPSQSQE
jgi:Ca2+-binding EF-hand superfamily protein